MRCREGRLDRESFSVRPRKGFTFNKQTERERKKVARVTCSSRDIKVLSTNPHVDLIQLHYNIYKTIRKLNTD